MTHPSGISSPTSSPGKSGFPRKMYFPFASRTRPPPFVPHTGKLYSRSVMTKSSRRLVAVNKFNYIIQYINVLCQPHSTPIHASHKLSHSLNSSMIWLQMNELRGTKARNDLNCCRSFRAFVNRRHVLTIHNVKTVEVGQEVLSERSELRNLTPNEHA